MGNLFLKNLKTLEDEIIVKKSSEYSKKTKVILQKLINVIESGVGFKGQSDLFILKNFRLTNKELLRVWNQDYTVKPKSAGTIRVQLSNLNKVLSKLYGNDLLEIFLGEQVEGLSRVNDTCDAVFLNEKFDSNELFRLNCFPDDYEYSGKTYEFSDLKDEIDLLVRVSDVNISNLVKKCDLDKLFYIRERFTKDTILDSYSTINLEKLQYLRGINKILKKEAVPALGIDMKKDSIEGEPSKVEEKPENYETNSNSFDGSSLYDTIIKFSDGDLEIEEGTKIERSKQITILKLLLRATTEQGLMSILSQIDPEISKKVLDVYNKTTA